MKSGIYQIKNIITDKVYIGSAININLRWKEHLNDLKGNKHHSIKLQRSFNIHGIDNFMFEVIEPCDIIILIEREQFFIDMFDSYNNGYNCIPTAGSRLGSIQSEETKEKIRQKLKGRVSPRKGVEVTDETKIKMSNSKLGVSISEEAKVNMSKSKLGNKNPFYGKKVKEENKQYKKINQLSKDGVLIKEWPSITECANFFNIDINSISKVLHGKRKTTAGFKFEIV